MRPDNARAKRLKIIRKCSHRAFLTPRFSAFCRVGDGAQNKKASQPPRLADFFMVGVARIELATPAMSTQCSTTELHAHAGCDVARGQAGRNPGLPDGKPDYAAFFVCVLFRAALARRSRSSRRL